MRFRASVVNFLGRTRHSIGTVENGLPKPVPALPTPMCLEIRESDGGWYLLHLDAAGASFADTWHETLDDAKAQARFEFDIPSDGWMVV